MTQPNGGSGPSLLHSPRFPGSSARNLAEIAAKVVNNGDYEDYYYDVDVFRELDFDDLLQKTTPGDQIDQEESIDGNSEFEFEFPVPQSEENSSPISAGQIFADGKIKPLFPVFVDEDRLISPQSPRPSPASSSDIESNSNSDEIVPIQIPLWKLLLSDREASLTASVSCSSSEADELEAVYPPKEEMSKKSKSTGTSKRWKLRNLVRRSRSDGRDNFVFWIPKQRRQVEKSGDGETTPSSARDARRENCEKKKKKSDVVRFLGNGSGVNTATQTPQL